MTHPRSCPHGPDALSLCCCRRAGRGTGKPPPPEDFYSITTLPIPKGVVLEAGGLELLPKASWPLRADGETSTWSTTRSPNPRR
ncbi:MAG: hypothetical protein Ct9H300mP1_23350 [Planctomycetaceae bacterium]|nr:MAG: hypothetical protein Ct9H300mP1_23350 [Planctomycetaceae bacterium]